MTVVSALKFNKNHAVIVADERVTYSTEVKHDIAIKIFQVCEGKVNGFIGGCGLLDTIVEGVERIRDSLETGDKLSIASLKRSGGDVMMSLKESLVDEYIQGKFGLRAVDFQRGKRVDPTSKQDVDLDESFVESYKKALKSKKLKGKIDADFLAIFSDKSKVAIYGFAVGERPRLVELPYETIGSGYDKADDILADFVKSVPREKRGGIDHLRGMSAILYATFYAGYKVSSVGGTPLIKIVKGDKIIEPCHANSRLAMEIGRGVRAGYLTREFEYQALDDLLYQNADKREVNERMKKKARDWSALDDLLRDYPAEAP